MRSSPKTAISKKRHCKTRNRIVSPIVLNAAGGDRKGEINLIWEPDDEAWYYILQRCSELRKPLKWKYEDIISTAKYTVSNLKSKKSYIFRVAVVTESGKSIWSKPVIKKAP